MSSGGKFNSALLGVYGMGSCELIVANLAQVGNRRPTQMIKLLGQMLKVPMAAFVASMEIIARTMRDFQKTFDDSVEAITGDGPQNPLVDSTGNNSVTVASTGSTLRDGSRIQNLGEPEEIKMPEQADLSGEDLKLVRYKVVYTKRDHEKLLEAADGLVNYDTTACDYGALKVQEFMRNNPIIAAGLDGKYVSAFVELLWRFPKREKEYDRIQVRVLEEIRDKI